MVGDRRHELLDRNVKCLAHSQQREDRDGAASFHHLPMAHAEAVRDHILLAQFTRGSESPDFVAEPTKKTSIMSGKFSAGPHTSKLGEHEQKHHEQNCVYNGIERHLPLPASGRFPTCAPTNTQKPF